MLDFESALEELCTSGYTDRNSVKAVENKSKHIGLPMCGIFGYQTQTMENHFALDAV